jgi:hypothetical protein
MKIFAVNPPLTPAKAADIPTNGFLPSEWKITPANGIINK